VLPVLQCPAAGALPAACDYSCPPPKPTSAGAPIKYPAVLESEFKRPTLLPATLRMVRLGGSKEGTRFAIMTGDGAKEVVTGRLHQL
jgi:hypothetical protein